MENNRLAQWLRFAEFFLGTVVIGGITLCVNQSYQERQLDQTKYVQQKELELKEMELLGTFVQTAMNGTPGDRRRFAEYFATLTTSDNLRLNWIFYRDSVVGREIDNIQNI